VPTPGVKEPVASAGRLPAFAPLCSPRRAVFCHFSTMKRRPPRSNAPGEKWRAGVCLFALFLLWAPAWAAASQSSSMACCAGGMCPAHGRGQGESNRESSAQKTPATRTCQAQGQNAGMRCDMACCHPETPVLTGTIHFVLPKPATLLTHPLAERPGIRPGPSMEVCALQPVSPPPRTLSASL